MTGQQRDEKGPVPVRHGVQPGGAGRAEPVADEPGRSDREGGGGAGDEATPAPEHRFEVDGESWVARPAGEGAYGTGRRGTARLLAVHFFRAAEPERPVREALIPAGAFEDLWEEELRTMLERATAIEADR